jgi:hypothetical protein
MVYIIYFFNEKEKKTLQEKEEKNQCLNIKNQEYKQKLQQLEKTLQEKEEKNGCLNIENQEYKNTIQELKENIQKGLDLITLQKKNILYISNIYIGQKEFFNNELLQNKEKYEKDIKEYCGKLKEKIDELNVQKNQNEKIEQSLKEKENSIEGLKKTYEKANKELKDQAEKLNEEIGVLKLKEENRKNKKKLNHSDSHIIDGSLQYNFSFFDPSLPQKEIVKQDGVEKK